MLRAIRSGRVDHIHHLFGSHGKRLHQNHLDKLAQHIAIDDDQKILTTLIRNLYRSSFRSYPARDELFFRPN
jgi:hypothetical protein